MVELVSSTDIVEECGGKGGLTVQGPPLCFALLCSALRAFYRWVSGRRGAEEGGKRERRVRYLLDGLPTMDFHLPDAGLATRQQRVCRAASVFDLRLSWAMRGRQ